MPALRVQPLPEMVRWWVRSVADDQHADSLNRTDSVSPKSPRDAFATTIKGVAGEAAFAFLWGIQWAPKLRQFNGMDPDFAPDILLGEGGIEVRTANTRTLKITDRDVENCPDRTFWAVWQDTSVTPHVYWVLGFIKPSEVVDYPQVDPGDRGKPYRRIEESDLHPASDIIELDYPASAWNPESGDQVETPTAPTTSQPLPSLHPDRNG